MRRYGLSTALAGTLLAGLALTGCAGGDDAVRVEPASPDAPTSSGPGDPAAPPAGTAPAAEPLAAQLTVVLDDTGTGQTRTFTLTCEPPGGDHPDPASACAALAQAGTTALQPAPQDQMCTQQYGGPQTATVEGTVAGQPVSASYSRGDGCEISRWNELAPLLGTPGGVEN